MTSPKKSWFIVIEGVDFSGKTTLVERLKKVLDNDEIINNYFEKIIYTEEPNKGILSFCKEIRKMVLEYQDINNITRGLLFFASRSEHISKWVKPNLKSGGCLVICDRFGLSTIVSQGRNDEKLTKWIIENQKMVADLVPNMTYLINISEELFLKRYNATEYKDTMDHYTKENFKSVQGIYLSYVEDKKEPCLGKIVCLDGENGVDSIVLKIQQDIRDLIKSWTTN